MPARKDIFSFLTGFFFFQNGEHENKSRTHPQTTLTTSRWSAP